MNLRLLNKCTEPLEDFLLQAVPDDDDECDGDGDGVGDGDGDGVGHGDGDGDNDDHDGFPALVRMGSMWDK